MGSVLFIVWRESIEAVLVIGILYAYLLRLGATRRGFAYLWVGVTAGIGVSVLLALATLGIQSELRGQQLQYFQTSMLFIAAVLMTQMVLWMNKHGRTLKRTLEADMNRAISSGRLIGVALIALLAVAREGSETVLYVYSLGLERAGGMSSMLAMAALGFLLALATAWGVSKGARFLSYKIFFRITTVILLFSAAGLLVSGMSNLIGMGLLPSIVQPVWNTSAVLNSGSRIGGVVSALTGYRSQPSLMLVIAYLLYWSVTIGWILSRRQVRSVEAISKVAA